jgi:ankyrin repeat protein
MIASDHVFHVVIKYGNNALIEAVKSSNVDAVALLLDAGIDIESRSRVSLF